MQQPPQFQNPSLSLLHAQYWCYVTSARRDMTPENFQGFLGALGPPPPQPLRFKAPSPSMLHALYWCYVTDARTDMAPEEFQEFLGTLGPPHSPNSSRTSSHSLTCNPLVSRGRTS